MEKEIVMSVQQRQKQTQCRRGELKDLPMACVVRYKTVRSNRYLFRHNVNIFPSFLFFSFFSLFIIVSLLLYTDDEHTNKLKFKAKRNKTK